MKAITIKQNKEFAERVEKILQDNTFKKIETPTNFWPSYCLKTSHGNVYFHPGNSVGSTIYSIFGRFENPEHGKQFNCNPYSGKCNIHTFAENGINEPCNQLENIIKNIEK